MLTTGNQNTRQNGMGHRTAAVAITTVGLARDDRRAQHALRQIVGGLQLVDIQEAQQMRTMFTQALGEAGIITIGEGGGAARSRDPMRFQFLGSLMKREGIQAVFLGFQRQSLLQDNRHLAGKVQGSATLALLHLLQIFQQMTNTFLFEPLLQFPIIIGQITVRGQNAFELFPQDIDHHVTAAIIADGIHGHFLVGEDPQPSGQRPDPPTGLIRIDYTAPADSLQQLDIHGLGGMSQLLIGLTPATSTHLQSKGVVEYFTDLAIRDTQSMLEIRRQGLRPWSHHHTGGSCGKRGRSGCCERTRL